MKASRLMVIPLIAAAVASPNLYASRVGDYGQTTFQATLTLFTEIEVETVKNLEFGDVMVTGSPQAIVVDNNSDQAAQFTATGDRNARVSAKVVEESITMSAAGGGPRHEIMVDQWNYGGNVDGNGAGQFNVNGGLPNIRVGAVAHVKSDSEYGNYVGTATMRVTYV